MPITVLPQQREDSLSQLGPQLLQFFLQKEQLKQQKEEFNLRKQTAQFEQEQQLAAQQATEQTGQTLLAFLAQNDPQTRQLLMQRFPGAVTPAVAGAPAQTATLPAGPAPAGLASSMPGPQIQQPALAGQPARLQTSRIPGAVAAQLAAGIPALRASLAETRKAEVAANVAEATERSTIDVANLEPALARGQLKDLKAITQGRELQNAYQVLLNTRDPQRVNTARALFETGAITWGQARQTAGLPEDLIPDNTVFVPAGGTQANAEALKNQGFAQMMQVSHGIINQLNDQGVRLSFLPSLQRGTKFATFDAFVNVLSGSEQERLVNAQRMFGDAYRFSLSGQQSSDREALRMLNAIAEQVGDSEETIAQKRVLREVMINVTRMKAGGAIDAIQGARMGLNAAKNTGNPETIKLFEEILQTTIDQQQGTGMPSSSPTDPANIFDRIEVLDSLIDQGVGIGVGGVRRVPNRNR